MFGMEIGLNGSHPRKRKIRGQPRSPTLLFNAIVTTTGRKGQNEDPGLGKKRKVEIT